jgi:hypothetical protein
MPHRTAIALTALCSLAALLTLASGESRPAGVRTAFELIDGKSGGRQTLMLNGLKSVLRS